MRNAFLLYIDRLEVLDDMTDADAGKLFRAIRDYVKDGSTPERGTIVSIAFLALKPALDSDSEKYHLMCLKRSEAGKKGGRPRKQENSEASDEKQEEAKKASAFEEEANESKKSKCFFEKAKKADTNTNTNTNTDNTPPVVGVLSAGARVDVGDDGVKLPVSPTDTVPLDKYFVAQLHEMYPEIDISAEMKAITLKMIATNYPCRNQTSMQKYVLEWMKRVEKDTESKRLNEVDADALNERMLHLNAEDI